MTIKLLVNACDNSHPEIVVNIWTAHRDQLLYSGLYEKLTDRMLNWEASHFNIKNFLVTDYGRTFVTEMDITLEYRAEFN